MKGDAGGLIQPTYFCAEFYDLVQSQVRKTIDLSRSPMDELNVKAIQEMTSVQLMYDVF